MKLQIVEYRYNDIMLFCKGYYYTLEIDGRDVVCTSSMKEKASKDEIYNKLTKYLAYNCKDYNINHYQRHKEIIGMNYEVIIEQEVSDQFLKENFVSNRIKELAEDFK